MHTHNAVNADYLLWSPPPLPPPIPQHNFHFLERLSQYWVHYYSKPCATPHLLCFQVSQGKSQHDVTFKSLFLTFQNVVLLLFFFFFGPHIQHIIFTIFCIILCFQHFQQPPSIFTPFSNEMLEVVANVAFKSWMILEKGGMWREQMNKMVVALLVRKRGCKRWDHKNLSRHNFDYWITTLL